MFQKFYIFKDIILQAFIEFFYSENDDATKTRTFSLPTYLPSYLNFSIKIESQL